MSVDVIKDNSPGLGFILTREPFILTDELRARVEKWIERENEMEQETR